MTDILRADVAEAESLAATAQSNHDAACAQLAAARDAMAAANRAFVDADTAWKDTLAELDAARKDVTRIALAAGLVLTAAGWVPADGHQPMAVRCPHGCELGTSAIGQDEVAAEARITTHRHATRRTGRL